MDMDWKNFGAGWRRTSYVVPGWDCRVECKHEHKGDHGIHDDEWIYVVSDGECAVSLRVGSGSYPATMLHVDPKTPRGSPTPGFSIDCDPRNYIEMGEVLVEVGRRMIEQSVIPKGSLLDGLFKFDLDGAPKKADGE